MKVETKKRKAVVEIAAAASMKRKDAPGKQPEARLDYPGKKSESEFIGAIPESRLKEKVSFGQLGLYGRQNLLIHGDNLVALKYLLGDERIAGKVKLVYIDPPFSTGQEFRIGKDRTSTVSSSNGDMPAYEDRLAGPQFMEFLRQRLILIRKLLSSDGSIYLHIDCKVGHYVKVLMDEVFGPENFVNDITRIKCNPKNFSRKGYGNIKDMILFYSKTKDFIWNEPRVEMTEDDIERLFRKRDKDGRRYTTTPLHAPGETKNGETGCAWKGLFPPAGRHWRVSPKELSRLDKMGLIEWSKSGNPRKKVYADEIISRGKKLQDVWRMKDPPYPAYPTEKNIELVSGIIEGSSNPGDLVMDCFAGSGTTLAAAEESRRSWIGIDSSMAAVETAAKRLREMPEVSAFSVCDCVEAGKKWTHTEKYASMG